jgi:hypothetical protein
MLEPQVVVNLLPKLGIGADLLRHGYVKVLLAFFGFSPMRSHFWPFTEVVRKIRREVTRKDPEIRKRALNRDARAQGRFQRMMKFYEIKLTANS